VLLGLALVVLVARPGHQGLGAATLTPGEKIDLIGSLISLNLIRNPGAPSRSATAPRGSSPIVSLAILGWVLVAARKVGTRAWAVALGLLLGGALGNLGDRFFREPGPGRGHVVDFIDYFGWFIGNVADIAIVVGAGVIMVLAYRGTPVSGPPHHPEHAHD
jgi:signal peptidase II